VSEKERRGAQWGQTIEKAKVAFRVRRRDGNGVVTRAAGKKLQAAANRIIRLVGRKFGIRTIRRRMGGIRNKPKGEIWERRDRKSVRGENQSGTDGK